MSSDSPAAVVATPTHNASLPLLGTLYVSQSIGAGFLTVGLTSILRDGGKSLATLGLLNLIGLAWALKFLWAPMVDRFGSARVGHYRSWLLPLQLGLVASLCFLLPYADPARKLAPIVAVTLVYVVFSATQDIAVDALAVRLIGNRERGPVNGIQIAASYLGSVLGGGVAVVIYDRFGWVPAIGLLAALTGVGLIAAFVLREPPTLPDPTLTPSLHELFGVLRQPGCASWALGVVPLFYIGSGVVSAMLSPALVDVGWSLSRIGIVTGVYASIPAIGAGLIAGWLIRARGRAWVLGLGGGLIVVAIGALAPLFAGVPSSALATAAVSLFMAAYTVANVVAYTVMMDFSRAATAGSDFTVLSCLGLGFAFIAGFLALTLAAWVGYLVVAGLGAVLILAATIRGVRQVRGMDAARRNR